MNNADIREQIQENIICYIDSKVLLHPEQFGSIQERLKDDLCQIVVDCFAEDKKESDPSRYFNHPEEVYNRRWIEANKS